jgi:hypothetical protein
VLFALVAATSPLALASVLVVLTGSRARLNGIALAVGFVAGQAMFLVLALVVGVASSPDSQNHPGAVSVLETAFGVALLVTAAYVRRHRGDEPEVRSPSPRTEAIRAHLANLRPLTALGTGAALGIGGPKRISVTLVTCAAIAAAGVSGTGAVGLGVLYVALATMLVWLPVLLYVMLGERATEWLTERERWIGAHKEPFTFYPSAVLGVVLVVDGILRLAA